MPKRKQPELDPKEQFKRFQEAAKELGVDKAQEEVSLAFTRLAASQASKPKKKT